MSLDRDARRAAMFLISPALLVLLALNVFPMLYAVDISLYYWRLAGLQAAPFIGLQNYEPLFGDARFFNSIFVSLGFVADWAQMLDARRLVPEAIAYVRAPTTRT